MLQLGTSSCEKHWNSDRMSWIPPRGWSIRVVRSLVRVGPIEVLRDYSVESHVHIYRMPSNAGSSAMGKRSESSLPVRTSRRNVNLTDFCAYRSLAGITIFIDGDCSRCMLTEKRKSVSTVVVVSRSLYMNKWSIPICMPKSDNIHFIVPRYPLAGVFCRPSAIAASTSRVTRWHLSEFRWCPCGHKKKEIPFSFARKREPFLPRHGSKDESGWRANLKLELKRKQTSRKMTTSMAAAIAASLPAPTAAAPTSVKPTYEAIPSAMSKVVDVLAEIPITSVQLDAMVHDMYHILKNTHESR